MKELLGKKIISLYIGEDEHSLIFKTNEGLFGYSAVGDCCSESWFSDITGVDALIGGTVSEVMYISMDGYNVEDGRGRQEEDDAYGIKIVTDKGMSSIVYRNSSNGYYGGYLEGIINPVINNEMREITDDFMA